MVTLARLLTPTDYGFYVVALSINALSTAFMASALERALIIEGDLGAMEGRSIPILCALVSVALVAFAIVMVIISTTGWAVAPGVLATVMGAQLIAAIALVPRAKLRQIYRYPPIVGGEVAGLVIGNLFVGVVLAQRGFGPFALALGMMVGNAVSAFAILAVDRTGLCGIRFKGLGELRATALGTIKVSSAEAANSQITPLVLSALLGPVSLGLFNRIYNLAALPIQLLISSVNRVTLASFVDSSENRAQSRMAIRRVVRIVAFLTIPVAAGIGGASDEFVRTVLGEQWIDGAPIVPFVTLAITAMMIATVLGQLADANKRFDEKVRVQVISTIILVIATIVGSQADLIGVGIAILFASSISLALSIDLAARIIAVRRTTIVAWLLSSVAIGFVCFVLNDKLGLLLENWPVYGAFCVQIAGSALMAGLGALLLLRDVLVDLISTALPKSVADRCRRLLRV
tara:strand:+ start:9358 stop:10737 length:1380 start_codon:yes stop_codon:yes gene_type:complete